MSQEEIEEAKRREKAAKEDKMSADYPGLKESEVAAAREAARKKIEAARKKALMKDAEEKETLRLEREEGLTTGIKIKDEIVNVTIDCAEFADRIVVNFHPYFHGRTYPVPRHVADSLNEIMARGHKHQDELDGKSLTQHYAKPRNTVISAIHGASNAPKAPA